MSLLLKATDKAITVPANIVDSLTIPGAGNNLAARLEMFPRTNDAAALVNRRNPAAVPVKIGTPGYDGVSALVSAGATYGSHGFDTGIVPTEDDQTFALVFRPVAGTAAATLFGTSQSTQGVLGISQNLSGAGKLNFSNLEGSSAAAAAVSTPATPNYLFVLGTGSSKGYGRIRVGVAGVLGAAGVSAIASPNAHSQVTPTTKIGSTILNNSNAQFRVYYAARIARIGTPAEEEALYARIRAIAAAEGVTIE